jgi:hypothetical protein
VPIGQVTANRKRELMFAHQDQDERRTMARSESHIRFQGMTAGARRIAAGAMGAAALTLPLFAGATAAQAVTSFHPLTLLNGWTNAPFGTSNAAVANISVIVHLKGAIATTGTNSDPLILPSADRPATTVYVKVDLCNATNGRLQIAPSGVVTAEGENGNFSNAQCFTSLDGASFAKSATSFTPLTLLNGWANYSSTTASPAARTISGVVHLQGAIATTGTNPVPFVLPSAFRPAATVYVPVDLCDATNGRLQIEPNGTVTVEAGNFNNAQCFTSLEGVSYAKSASSYTALTLKNGWSGAPFSTSKPAVRTISGIVILKGAMSTAGTNPVAFTLPSGFRPATTVYVAVDLCNATNGRLQIGPNGTVTVEAEGGTFSNAQCFTSLDGVSFAP